MGAVGMNIKVEGLAQLERKLKALGPRVSQNVLRKALRAAMKPVLEDARRRAQTLLRRRSGRLSSGKAIKVEVSGKRGGAAIKLGFAKGAAYGIPLELGTSFFAPRPMLRPALDTKAEEAVRIFKDVVGEEIEKVAKSG